MWWERWRGYFCVGGTEMRKSAWNRENERFNITNTQASQMSYVKMGAKKPIELRSLKTQDSWKSFHVKLPKENPKKHLIISLRFLKCLRVFLCRGVRCSCVQTWLNPHTFQAIYYSIFCLKPWIVNWFQSLFAGDTVILFIIKTWKLLKYLKWDTSLHKL